MSTDLTPRGDLRASDADRDAVARHLATALSEGRLDLEEYQGRLDSTMGAVTMADLVPLTTDLPSDPAGTADAQAAQEGPVDLAETGKQKAARSRRPGEQWQGWAGVAVIMIGIWLISSITSGDIQFFWPAIPLGIWAVVLLAGGGRWGGCGR